MNDKLAVMGLIVGSALVGIMGLPSHPAEAQVAVGNVAEPGAPVTSESESSSEPSGVESPASVPMPEGFASYSYNGLFSVGLPSDWQVTEQTASPQLTATSTSSAATAVRTEITWFDIPPKEIVPQAIQTIQTNGYSVVRYEAANIDGTTALRIWVADLPEALPNALMTYIGYEQTTAVITSYYGAPDPAVDDLLDIIHQSFQRTPAGE
ncbi:MAG: hypothetical protein HC922_08930 [Leptolyngbyaceae cyanobacterium SM2_3_12]|nr:hypothetical protein [Leptolyngbyaceae cyanobacterium SM2_3_12]